jgi:hypothetical protein
VTVGGTASDAVGVTQVTWANSRGGSGTAIGTTTWSASAITLLGGSNVITITARDAAGNTSTDTLTVTYNAPDTTAPVATITAPTSLATFTTSTTPLTVGGTASDAVGVTQVTWANDRGGSGTATGTTSWSASGITLLGGSNVITITARDAAGNSATDTLTVHLQRTRYDGPRGDHHDADVGFDVHRDYDAIDGWWHGERRRRCDAGHVGQRPRRQRHRDRHDELECQRHRRCRTARTVITITARDAAGNRRPDV